MTLTSPDFFVSSSAVMKNIWAIPLMKPCLKNRYRNMMGFYSITLSFNIE